MIVSARSAIVAKARSYIGTPWGHMGRAPGIALDCAGILVCVARARGLVAADFDVPEYTMNADGRSLIAWCNQYMGGPVTRTEMQAGDAVVMITDQYPQHLGILGDYRHGGLSIIHASNARSVVPPRVIETRLMFSRAMRFVAAYKFPQVE
jgi:cell wall-associated NlpC family hydrolase